MLAKIWKHWSQNRAKQSLIEFRISALLLWNVSKYEFVTGKDVLAEKRFARKSCYNQNIWIFIIRCWVEEANWHCRETVQKTRQGLWTFLFIFLKKEQQLKYITDQI